MPKGSETIQIHQPAEKDWQGDPVGPPPAPIPVEGCIIWPQSTRESDGGYVVSESMSCYMPPGADAIPTSQDVIERMSTGVRYEVVGAVGHYIKGRVDKGYLFTMRRLGG